MLSPLPATPEKTIAGTSNRSSTARVVVAALTRPMPTRTSTTRAPASVPTWYVRSPVAIVSVTWVAASSGASSAGKADRTVTYGPGRHLPTRAAQSGLGGGGKAPGGGPGVGTPATSNARGRGATAGRGIGTRRE